MNHLSDPELFVRTACDQVRYLLDYRWVAVQYVPSPLQLSELSSDLIPAGDLPCDQKTFSRLATGLIQSWGSDPSSCILNPEDDELARAANTQVIAEPIAHDDIVIGALVAGGKRGSDHEVTSLNTQLLSAAAEFLGVFHQNASRYEVQRTLFMGTVTALSAAIDAKDRYTRGHSERVAMLARRLALACDWGKERAERVYIAGIVHDVGKIGVPEAVLSKPGKLTDQEFDLIKQHPAIGYDILKDIPPMSPILPGVLYHHERWDGNGYPRGLSGADTPEIARLLAVADGFDAMSSDRAYRPRMSREKVLGILRDGAGSQWDPQMVQVFLKLSLDEYDEMIARHVSRDARAA